MKTLTKSILVGLLAGVASTGFSQPPGSQVRMPIPFSAYDVSGDGFVSEQEFAAAQAERKDSRAAQGRLMRNAPNAPSFAEFDANSDGKLSPDELAIGQKMRGQQRLGQPGPVGTPGMGRGRNAPAFSDFDSDANGLISKEEFIEARNKRISDRVSQGYRMRGLSNAQPFEEIDRDGDGNVTPGEFSAAQAQHQR